MTIYILPTGPDEFPPQFFDGEEIPWKPYSGGNPYSVFWNEFSAVCSKLGVKLESYLSWDKSARRSDDVLLVLNHPGETFLWRAFYGLRYLLQPKRYLAKKRKFFFENHGYFGRRILIQFEPPVVAPYVFGNIKHLIESKVYEKMFFTSKLDKPECVYFNYYMYHTKPIVSQYFDDAKNKFLVMVNSNAFPHTLQSELYGKRLRAIKFFGGTGNFDLYGFHWNSPPLHPFYFYYGKYVRKVWRGTIRDKLKTVGEYKFALCFENCISRGWISEKIFDCFSAGTIPIYLGAPDIEKIIPPECFIDFRKFKTYNELYEFLHSRTKKDLETYRAAILKFLKTPANEKKLTGLVEEIIGE